MSQANPLDHLSFDRIQTTSFWEKLQDTFNVFCRMFCRGPKVGLLDYFSFGFFWGFGEFFAWIGRLVRAGNALWITVPIQILLGCIWALTYWVLGAILTAICAPIVGIVHLFTKPIIRGYTPVWKSFLTNPATWITLALALLGVGFLIQAVANPLIFSQAVIPLAILIPSLLILSGLLVAAWIFYSLYLAYGAFHEARPENVIMAYLEEHLEWMNENRMLSACIWGFGIIALGTAIGLTVDYFTGGLIPNSLIASLFHFMSQGFLTSFHALATLPGLDFFAAIPAESLAMTCQILSAITFVSSIFFITYSLSRLANTTGFIEYMGLQKDIEAQIEEINGENEEPDKIHVTVYTNRHTIKVGPLHPECVMIDGVLFSVHPAMHPTKRCKYRIERDATEEELQSTTATIRRLTSIPASTQ